MTTSKAHKNNSAIKMTPLSQLLLCKLEMLPKNAISLLNPLHLMQAVMSKKYISKITNTYKEVVIFLIEY
jgi:hypothetical protein